MAGAFSQRGSGTETGQTGSTLGPRFHRTLLRVKHFALRRYGSYPNVLGVGIGTKFKRHRRASVSSRRIGHVTSIQFFVSRKRQTLIPRHRLPSFVYHRFPNERIDRRRKIPTDVIPVGRIHAACGAGSHLDSNRDHGLITLIFRNQAESGKPFHLISCAHVVGDLHRSPPAYVELTSDCSTAEPFARTRFNSTADTGEVTYDIAMARIDDSALPLKELRVRDETFSLNSFFPLRLIQPGLGVSVVLRNYSSHGAVDSLHASASVSYGSETFLLHNLFGVNVPAAKGDSGGLIYKDTQAVGIVVAASPRDWLWFQPLQSAISFLEKTARVGIRPFKP